MLFNTKSRKNNDNIFGKTRLCQFLDFAILPIIMQKIRKKLVNGYLKSEKTARRTDNSHFIGSSVCEGLKGNEDRNF